MKRCILCNYRLRPLETSSQSNVVRMEKVKGRGAIDHLRKSVIAWKGTGMVSGHFTTILSGNLVICTLHLSLNVLLLAVLETYPV